MVLLALSMVVATAACAQAADLCMDYSGGGSWVFKRFKIPRKNRCVPLQGFENVPYGGSAMAGMGCTNLDGNTLTLHYTSHGRYYPRYFETGLCEIVLPMPPAGTYGACYGTWTVAPGDTINSFGQSVAIRRCDVDLRY